MGTNYFNSDIPYRHFYYFLNSYWQNYQLPLLKKQLGIQIIVIPSGSTNIENWARMYSSILHFVFVSQTTDSLLTRLMSYIDCAITTEKNNCCTKQSLLLCDGWKRYQLNIYISFQSIPEWCHLYNSHCISKENIPLIQQTQDFNSIAYVIRHSVINRFCCTCREVTKQVISRSDMIHNNTETSEWFFFFILWDKVTFNHFNTFSFIIILPFNVWNFS